jgi:hypothetical protein
MDISAILLGYLPLILSNEITMDTIIKFMLLVFGYVFTRTNTFNIIHEKILRFFHKKRAEKMNRVLIKAAFDSEGFASHSSETYRAVMYFIKNYLYSHNEKEYDLMLNPNDSSLNIKEMQPIELENGINIELESNEYEKPEYTSNNNNNNNNFKKYIEYTLILSRSITNNISIEDFLSEQRKQYIKYLDLLEETDGYKYICTINSVEITEGTSDYDITKFTTTKSFDNLFFTGKERLIQKLKYFKENEEEYKTLGIPYTLGIMLHGVPGSGKTSTIKAIARYMDRNILLFPFKNMQSIKDLEWVFSESSYEMRRYAAPENCVLIFEEIDCCEELADVVRSRKLESLESKKPVFIKNKNKNKNSKNKNVDDDEIDDDIISLRPKVSLGELLSFLDGIIEHAGRVMIFTSNYPEELDEALVRPGRIDLNIEFGKLSKADVNNLYLLWFKSNIPQEIFDQMVDDKFTQAEIGLLFSSKDLNLIHNSLSGKK